MSSINSNPQPYSDYSNVNPSETENHDHQPVMPAQPAPTTPSPVIPNDEYSSGNGTPSTILPSLPPGGVVNAMSTPSSAGGFGLAQSSDAQASGSDSFFKPTSVGEYTSQFWGDRNFKKLNHKTKLDVLSKLGQNSDNPESVDNLKKLATDRGFRKLGREQQRQMLNAWDQAPAQREHTESIRNLANDYSFRRLSNEDKTRAIRELGQQAQTTSTNNSNGLSERGNNATPATVAAPPQNSPPSTTGLPEYWSIPEQGRNEHQAYDSNGNQYTMTGLKGGDSGFGPGGIAAFQNSDGSRSLYSVDDRTNQMHINRLSPGATNADKANKLTMTVDGKDIPSQQIEAMAFDGENFYVGQIGNHRPNATERVNGQNQTAIDIYKVSLEDVDQAVANENSKVAAQHIRAYYPDQQGKIDAESMVYGTGPDGQPKVYVATKNGGKSTLYSTDLNQSANGEPQAMERIGKLDDSIFTDPSTGARNRDYKLTDIAGGKDGLLVTIDREDRGSKEKHLQHYIPADPSVPGSIEQALLSANGMQATTPAGEHVRNEATSWLHERTNSEAENANPRVPTRSQSPVTENPAPTDTSSLPQADADVVRRLDEASPMSNPKIEEVKRQLNQIIEDEFGDTLSDERKAMWRAELQTEQAVPSITANGKPGGKTGRDASKDYRTDGSMNIGPWNDNVAMLSQYGGLEVPLRNGGYGVWGEKDANGKHIGGSRVDWSQMRRDFTGEATLERLPEIMRAKNQAMNTMGLDAYMAGRRAGTGVLNYNGNEKPDIDFSPKGHYWSNNKYTAWKAGHLDMANRHLENPAYMTDSNRYAYNYDHA